MYIHIASGALILILTIVFSIIALWQMSWEVQGSDVHNILGIIVLAVILFVNLTGFLAR